MIRDLHEYVTLALYGGPDVEDDLGIDPDRVPVRDGTSIVLEAVITWLEQPDIEFELYTTYIAMNEHKLTGRAIKNIVRRLIALAGRETP